MEKRRAEAAVAAKVRRDWEGADDENEDWRGSAANKGSRTSRSGSRGYGRLTSASNGSGAQMSGTKGKVSGVAMGSVDFEAEPEKPLELPTQPFDGFDTRLYAAVAAVLERLLYEKLQLCAYIALV